MTALILLATAAFALDHLDNDDPSNWCLQVTTYGAGDLGTPGAANDACSAD